MKYFNAKVKKMKAFSILSALFVMIFSNAQAQMQYSAPIAQSSSVAEIARRNVVRCGTNLRIKSYAYEEDGVWHGIDADFCRVIAQAITGDMSKFEMIHIPSGTVTEALDSGKIDVMLSGTSYSAQMETSGQVLGIGPLYFDRQYVMVRNDGSEDLAAYKDKKMCLSVDSGYQRHFEDFNIKHNLGIKYLTFGSVERAQEAFLLNRCPLFSASGLMLQGLKLSRPKLEAHVLPVKISVQPMYAAVKYNNLDLQIALKWVFNALFLAEQYNAKMTNLAFFATNDDPELRNLFGDNPQLWRDLRLQPNWLRAVIGTLGNYGEIFERDLGKDSEFKLPRDAGKLLRDGGSIVPLPFI